MAKHKTVQERQIEQLEAAEKKLERLRTARDAARANLETATASMNAAARDVEALKASLAVYRPDETPMREVME